jgi:TFIIF-interacting CTD phosphatase-like protein
MVASPKSPKSYKKGSVLAKPMKIKSKSPPGKRERSRSPICRKPRKKGNVILDIDGTLICAIEQKDVPQKSDIRKSKLKAIDMEDMYRVFLRPHVEEFLDWLCDNYNVAIWTAASKDYAIFILNYIINPREKRKQGRCIDFIFYDYHTRLSEKTYGGHKDLRMIWEIFGMKGYNAKNTVIIDDYDRVFKPQPCHALAIKEFDFFSKAPQNDRSLHLMRTKLTKLKFPNACPVKG